MARREWLILLLAAVLSLVVSLVAIRGPGAPVEPHGITNFDSVQAESYGVLTAQTTLSVTAGSAITPTGTYMPVQSSGTITTSGTTAIVSGTVAGQLLWLVDVHASNTVAISDTANTNLSASVIVLGPGDTLLLFWDGADWVQLSRSDN